MFCGDKIISALFFGHHADDKFLSSGFFKAGMFGKLMIEELGELARGYFFYEIVEESADEVCHDVGLYNLSISGRESF